MSSVSEEIALAEEKQERAENAKKVEELVNSERLTRLSEAIIGAEDDSAEREKQGALADAAMDAEKNRRLAEFEAEKIMSENSVSMERKENQASVKKAVDAEQQRQIEEWNAGVESEAEVRKKGIALAIELEDKEQQRRIIEAEQEKLQNMESELLERFKNQEAAVRAMEAERVRRISEDPSAVTHVKNSPHVRRRSFVLAATQAIDDANADDISDEEERLKSGVVADAAAAAEKEIQILREAVEAKIEAVETEAIRKLNQNIADQGVEGERKRRVAEEVADKEEEKKEREKNRQLVKKLEEEERERRVSEVSLEMERARMESEAERRANQVLVTQQVEEERVNRIKAAPAKLPSSPRVRASLPIKV